MSYLRVSFLILRCLRDQSNLETLDKWSWLELSIWGCQCDWLELNGKEKDSDYCVVEIIRRWSKDKWKEGSSRNHYSAETESRTYCAWIFWSLRQKKSEVVLCILSVTMATVRKKWIKSQSFGSCENASIIPSSRAFYSATYKSF